MTTPEDSYQAQPSHNPLQAYNAAMQSIAARIDAIEAWRAANDNLEADQEEIVAAILASLQTELDAISASFVEAQTAIDQVLNGEAQDSARLGAELPAFYRNASNLNAGTIPNARIPNSVLPFMSQTDSTTDWNAIAEAGFHPQLMTNSNANGPSDTSWSYSYVFKYASSALTQFAFPYHISNKNIYYRPKIGASWAGWEQLAPKSVNDTLYAAKDTRKMRYLGRTYFPSSDPAWAFDPKTTFARVFLLGGGGAGGYANSSANAGAASTGGNSGGWLWKDIDVASLGASPTAAIVIGAGGVASTTTPTDGSPTTYDDGTNVLSANGGKRGVNSNGTTPILVIEALTPAAQAGGDVNCGGEMSEGSIGGGDRSDTSGTYAFGMASNGGDSPFGNGGKGSVSRSATSVKVAGDNATGHGTGGGGASSVQNAGAIAGGEGADGLMYIDQWGE